MRCILHIGTEKTGTTSLQAALSSHRESLSKQGVLYARAPGQRNSRSLAAAFSTKRDEDDYLIEQEISDSRKFELWKSQLLASIDDEISEAEALNIWIEELNHIGELLYREGKYLYVISSTPSIKGLPYICVHWYAKLNKECKKAGDKIIGFAKIKKKTRSLIFMYGDLKCEDKLLASAEGIWKII